MLLFYNELLETSSRSETGPAQPHNPAPEILSFCPTNSFPEASFLDNGASSRAFTAYHPSVNFTFATVLQSTPCELEIFSIIASVFVWMDDMQSTSTEDGGASPSKILFIADRCP